jgi:hypothetical protein
MSELCVQEETVFLKRMKLANSTEISEKYKYIYVM